MPQAPASSFAIAALDASKVEDPRGITPYIFTVTRTGDTSAAATLAYAVSGSGANPAVAADFVGSAFPSGIVSFAPGDASQTIAVPVQGSPAARPNEGFTVTLSGAPAGSAITGASADGLIRTDDADTTPQAFAVPYTPKTFAVFTVSAYITDALAKRAGGATGTVAVSSAAAGPFRVPMAGVANAAVATAPGAGATLMLPAGYDALVAGGSGAVALLDGGAAGVLIGNGGGDSFYSTGAGSVLIGRGGTDVFSVSGSAKIGTGTGQSTVFANGSAAVDIDNSGTLTAVLGSGQSSIKNDGGATTVFCGAGDATVAQGGYSLGKLTVVGGDGRLTVQNYGSAALVFGGKGALGYTAGNSLVGNGNSTVVGGSGAMTVNAGGNGGSFWGYSGQDVITASCLFNVLAGVSGDRLTVTSGVDNTFVSLTGGVVMDGSRTGGKTVFFGGSAGTDTIITGGYAPQRNGIGQLVETTSTIVVTGSNASTVQLGAGKATVFANGSSTITSGAGSADLVFNDRTQFLLNAVAPGSTRVFALFNFVPGTEHISLRNYSSSAPAYALLTQVNAPGFTQLFLPDQTSILLPGVAHADGSVFA